MIHSIFGLFFLVGLLSYNYPLNASGFSDVDADQGSPPKSVASVEKVVSPVKEGKDDRVCLISKDVHEAAKPLDKEALSTTLKSKPSPHKSKNESIQIMPKDPEKIMQELLSKKFEYFGDNLSSEIQKIREGKSFQELTSIKKYLVEAPQVRALKKRKRDKPEVTIFVKKEDDDRGDVEGFKRALLGAAYFPEELDPRTKSSSLVSLANFTFIHRQLADALFYGHPLARKYLKEIISICNVPLEDNDFYNEFYHIPDSDLGNYNRYLLPTTARSATIEVVQEGDINQEITFPSYSKEMAAYFQQLLDQDQNPEKRYKKRKK